MNPKSASEAQEMNRLEVFGMRIAILAPAAWRTPHPHDALKDRVVALLANGLAERGDDVSIFPIIGLGACSSTWQERGPHSVAVEACLNLSEAFEVMNDFDIIHNHCGAVPLTYAGLTARSIITTMYSVPSPENLSVYRKSGLRSRYVAVSDYVRSPDLIYAAIVYPGIDITAITFEESHDGYLMCCGDIRPENGVAQAVEIAVRSRRQLVIAGPIGDQGYFEARIAPYLDRERITHLHSADLATRVRLLSRAAALLCLSPTPVAFDMSAIEANACGTPVIAYPLGAMTEIVSDGSNGYLVPDVNAAIEAVRGLDALSRRETRGIAEERFSATRMVGEYRALYAETLKSTSTEDHRPWGYYQILAERDDHKVKRIVVYPGKRLSLQRHKLRSEHWTIVSGAPLVVINEKEMHLKPGDSIEIPVGARHRIANPGKEPVVFVEVQTGDYFGEDDIERFEDDFNRVGSDVH